MTKEMVQLCFKISCYITIAICICIAIWFVTRIMYLCKKKQMHWEEVADENVEILTNFCNKLQQLPQQMQKAQLKAINPNFELYIQYYKVKLKCWLCKLGLS